jgi:hypothetical protein
MAMGSAFAGRYGKLGHESNNIVRLGWFAFAYGGLWSLLQLAGAVDCDVTHCLAKSMY